MTILKAEYVVGGSHPGIGEKADINGYFVSTNVFRNPSMLPGDFIEWDFTDVNTPVLNQVMTYLAADTSFARCFPVVALGGLFGKLYDIYGYNRSPRLIDEVAALGDRGYDGQRAPAADLTELAALQGFPVLMTELPNFVVTADATFNGCANNNVLCDMYSNRDLSPPAYYISDSNKVNDYVQPQNSKHLNLQVQMAWGSVRNASAHANGFSGATILGTAVIDGQQWQYGHKQETAGGNNFPFISFAGWDGTNYVPVTSFNGLNMWNWVIDNWNTILAQATTAGVSYAGITRATLNDSAVDGIHLGTEVLGGGSGSITFDEMSILITGGGGETDFTAWLNNSANSAHRLFLAEIDHGTGSMLAFANRGWLADTNVPYRSKLPNTPIFRQTLAGRSAGYLDAINDRTGTDDWRSYDIHGHGVRFLVGDDRWNRNQFRQMLDVTSKGSPQYKSVGLYRFGLVSDVSKFERPITESGFQYNDSAVDVINDIFDRLNSDPDTSVGTWRTIGAVNVSTEVRFDVTERDTADKLLVKIASSVNAYRRISNDGTLELVSKAPPISIGEKITGSIIEQNSIQQIGSTNPVARVIVPYFNATTETLTGADIGGLDTEVTIDSVLKNQADAVALGAIEAQRYVKTQDIWRMDLRRNFEELNVGEQRIFEHPAVSGLGTIVTMEWRPLEGRTRIEVSF